MLCIKKHLALDALKLMQSLVSGFQQKKVMPSSFLQAKVLFEKLQSELAQLDIGVRLWYLKRPLQVVRKSPGYKILHGA